ncbi:MAG: hypothetical protein J5482_01050 [Oscillospiraceae bacterium]|nr:hypothetical protein [Oscillospiraceae bacterium]
MANLSAGFSRVVINPESGTPIEGYFIERKTEGILDDLEINTLALRMGEETVLIMSMDLCQIAQRTMIRLRESAAEKTGVALDHVFMCCTHTHTGPFVVFDHTDPLVRSYSEKLLVWVAEAAQAAMDDLKPAKVGWGVGSCDIAHCRRLRMKDGSIRTNPGVGNPDVLEELTPMDHRVNVVRFDQQGGVSVVIINYGTHPDSIGGNKISADWPGFMRRTVELAIPEARCLFLNGAEGDVGVLDIWAKGGWFNDTFNDFDDVIRGYGHSRWYGRCMAGAVLQVYDKVNYFTPDSLKSVEHTIEVAAQLPSPEELPEAHRINDLHLAGRDSELGYEGMMLTTVVAEAGRMVRLEHGPESFSMPLHGVAIGKVALIGIAGEPFTGIGTGLKETDGWDLILPVCNADGAEGYFPMQECYDEGGYETRSSPFKEGVAEHIIEEGKKILREMEND